MQTTRLLSRTIFLTLALALLGLGDYAQAKASKGTKGVKNSYRQRSYGMAGCGIGSAMIKEKDRSSQIGVWAVNQLATYVFTSASPTYAMTSGTSNCSDSHATSAAIQREQEVFIAVNLSTLNKEAAQGGGSTIEALRQLLGCDGHRDYEALVALGRSQYTTIFAAGQPNLVLENYKRAIKQHHDLSAHCQRVLI